MADVIDSLMVRYEADIRPYLRVLKRLEAETGKSLSKLERRYDALLERTGKQTAQVLSQAYAVEVSLQLAVAQRAAGGTRRPDPRGRPPRPQELSPESIRREHDAAIESARLPAEVIELGEDLPKDPIDLGLLFLKRILTPLEGVDLRAFDVDSRLKDIQILSDEIERNRERLSTAEGVDMETAARELLENLRVFRSILSRAIAEFGARQGQLAEAADPSAPTTPAGAAKREELNRLQGAILEFVETIGDPDLTKAVRDAIDTVALGRGREPLRRPVPRGGESNEPLPEPQRAPGSSRRDEPDGGVIPAVFASGRGDARVNGAQVELEAIDGQAGAWRSVLAQVDEVPPALARTRRETLEVDRAARDLGFTFASAFEDAVVEGESLSDLLQGLEKDILRFLTRLLATEPLARGLTAGLGSFTGGGLGAGGGLEGALGGGLGALANLVPSPVAGLGLGRFNALDALAARDVANPLLAGIFQAGGPVHGPGGPTGDRIPTFLSDGEFVVNAKAA